MDGHGEEGCVKHYMLMQTPTGLARVVVCAHPDWAQWFHPQLLFQRKSARCLCGSFMDKNLGKDDAWSV